MPNLPKNGIHPTSAVIGSRLWNAHTDFEVRFKPTWTRKPTSKVYANLDTQKLTTTSLLKLTSLITTLKVKPTSELMQPSSQLVVDACFPSTVHAAKKS
jgi:hypothetical protein